MRLEKVRKGHALVPRLMMSVYRLIFRSPAPDVVRTLLYRPDYFGKPYSQWLQEVMRGPSAWSVGERELIAAFTSRLNHCPF
ncbi:MAG TPA: hypothetical protein VHN15_06420 [Thermoanaerobaculia bacterium]|nr:hypothetical protein [Thermoanaerobaculia bacterium]